MFENTKNNLSMKLNKIDSKILQLESKKQQAINVRIREIEQ
mgnify:CR=1 FL=1